MDETMTFWIFDSSNPQFDRMMAEVDLEGSDPTIPALRPDFFTEGPSHAL